MFKSKREKYAYIQGIKKGNRGGKPWIKKKKNTSSSAYKHSSSNPFGMTYEQMLREEEARKRELRDHLCTCIVLHNTMLMV